MPVWMLRAGIFSLLFIYNLVTPLVHYMYYSAVPTVCPIGFDGGGV
jgi:hypothetical protein